MAHTLTIIITNASIIYLGLLAFYFRKKALTLEANRDFWHTQHNLEQIDNHKTQRECWELKKQIERLQDMKNYADRELNFELWEEAHRQQRELMKLLERKK